MMQTSRLVNLFSHTLQLHFEYGSFCRRRFSSDAARGTRTRHLHCAITAQRNFAEHTRQASVLQDEINSRRKDETFLRDLVSVVKAGDIGHQADEKFPGGINYG